ncbi:MAG: hypothetical protein EPO26_07185 [Chloroflexota bacterium]|nr:MAG: hypothetical protein EPO26_07185 [Chloroflexota bacterium]
MAKYLLLYHGGGMPESEAEQKKVMDAWGAWYGQLGAAVADGGNPIGQTRTIAKDGTVTAGGGANPASGYTIISADTIDAAVSLAKGCPILAGGGAIEVCETFEM